MIARLAEQQAGRVARWQLLAAGLTADQIGERLRSRHLHPDGRGVYAAGHRAAAPRSAYFAAWLALGPEAAVSHDAAAATHDLRRDNRATVDVTVPRRARSRRGIRVHAASLHPDDVAVVDGLHVTSWPRTVLDLAARLPLRKVVRLLERAETLALYDGWALDALLARSNGHRGTGVLARAIHEVDPRHTLTRSDWETDVLPLLDALDLPRPLINHTIEPYEFDLFFARERVVVELDSWEHHRDRQAFENDRERDRWLARHGILGLRFTWRQVRDGALSELVEVLRQRGVARSLG